MISYIRCAATVAAVLCRCAGAQEVATLNCGTERPVRELVYSADGGMLASVSGTDAYVWDAKTNERVWNAGLALKACEMPCFLATPRQLLLATFSPRDQDRSYDVRQF